MIFSIISNLKSIKKNLRSFINYFNDFYKIKVKFLFSSKDLNSYKLSTKPVSLILDTTYVCNLTCRMCHQNSPDYHIPEQPHIPVEYVKSILDFAKDTESIYLLGYGEPFMHPNMYEIIKMLKTNCPKSKVETTTNGVLFNERNIKKLIDSKIDMISVSMDGPDLERGHQKSEVTYKNLRKICEVKKKLNINYPQITIGFILGDDNKDELIPIIEFAKEIEASAVTVDALRVISPQEDWDDYIIANDPYKHKDKIIPILEKAKQLAEQYKIRINLPYISDLN
jgi:MoaA/NifB/PqqE/SkfB family radical SAM enzyme